MASAHFDTSSYYKVAAPADLKTFPHWYALHVSTSSFLVYGETSVLFACERTNADNGFVGWLLKKCPNIRTANGSSSSTGVSDRAAMSKPEGDSWTFEFISATDIRVYLNGVLQGSSSTNITPDLSAGSPELRFGYRASGATDQGYDGNLQHVVAGTGTLSGADRTLHMTPSADYSQMSGASHWWKFESNGNDFIGSANLTMVGTVTFQAGDLIAARALPTATTYCQQVFKQSSLPSGTCTVTSGGTPPMTPSSNYAGCKHLDGSYVGTDTTEGSPFTFRVWEYDPLVPLSPPRAFLVGGGHQSGVLARIDVLINALMAAGYYVFHGYMPGWGEADPPDVSPSHDTMDVRLSPTVNPLEKFLIQFVMTINTIQGTFTEIYMTGLSGSAWQTPHQMAVDPRIKKGVAIRGSIAHRYYTAHGQDFEQWPEPNGWKAESIYYAAASPHRLLWFIHGVTDSSVAAKTKANDTGSYLDATNYTADVLAPVSAAYPRSNVQFFEDVGGDNDHLVTDFAVAKVLLAGSTSLGGLVPLPLFAAAA